MEIAGWEQPAVEYNRQQPAKSGRSEMDKPRRCKHNGEARLKLAEWKDFMAEAFKIVGCLDRLNRRGQQSTNVMKGKSIGI